MVLLALLPFRGTPGLGTPWPLHLLAAHRKLVALRCPVWLSPPGWGLDTRPEDQEGASAALPSSRSRESASEWQTCVSRLQSLPYREFEDTILNGFRLCRVGRHPEGSWKGVGFQSFSYLPQGVCKGFLEEESFALGFGGKWDLDHWDIL